MSYYPELYEQDTPTGRTISFPVNRDAGKDDTPVVRFREMKRTDPETGAVYVFYQEAPNE
jgi:hypothetical protein